MKNFNLKNCAVLCAALTASVSAPVFAIDTTGITTAIAASGTDIDTVAVAIFGVIGTMFAISKIRQVIKA